MRTSADELHDESTKIAQIRLIRALLKIQYRRNIVISDCAKITFLACNTGGK